MLCRGLRARLFFCILNGFIRGGQNHKATAQLDEGFRLVEMLLILLRQFRGERCKIFLAQTNHQKGTCDYIIGLAVFIPQGAIHGQTQQLALIVAHDGHRVSKGISSRDRAANLLL